jgi:hypothetical protein
MAEDPTLTATLLNMIVTGCQMHGNIFTLMGKGEPQYQTDPDKVIIVLNDGTYTITVAYQGPPIKLGKAAEEEQPTEEGSPTVE